MAHVDPNQVPSKGKPWTAISSLDFIHKVDLIVPEDAYELILQKVNGRDAPCFHRVTMTLGQVLDGEFFTEYIKRGNVLMLSEGKATVDNMFTLREGILDIYLDRETYERAGLVGKPYGVKGNRGDKPRWKVTYELRNSSMLHGRKGFDRLVYACKNVINQPLTWLFCNVANSTPTPDPLEKHSAVRITTPPVTMTSSRILQIPLKVPSSILAEGDAVGLEQTATDVYEWLSLIRLESPRVEANDQIDPYLARYSLPESDETVSKLQVCKLSWQGFLSSTWLRDLLISALVTCPSRSWFALSGTSFSRSIAGESNEITFLRPPQKAGEYLMWETKSID